MRDETGKFLPGNEGRPPGIPNKFSSLKEDLLEAYRAEAAKEKGGVAFLRSVKRRYPGLFLRVLSRLLPKEINLDLRDTTAEFAREVADQCREMDRLTMPLPPREPDAPGGNGGEEHTR